MAWDFQTEPEFQEQLDWAARFVREELWPIEPIAEAFALGPSQLPGPTAKFVFAGDPIVRHVADSGVDGLWPWSLRLGSDS
jgi:acyl-CoA dehydrogenase